MSILQVVGLLYSKEQWAMDWIFFCLLVMTEYLLETNYSSDGVETLNCVSMTEQDVL